MKVEAVKDPLLRSVVDAVAPFGIALVGVADVDQYRRLWPDAIRDIPERFSRAIVMAYPLLRGALSTIKDRPTHLYFHHYRQVNYVLDRAALTAGRVIEYFNYRALPVAASQTLDRGDMIAHISHRHLAYLSGMGWRGINNLLVTHQFGSAVRLVSVLTTAPLTSGKPLEGDPCSGCMACIRACPAKAIHETREDFDLDACYVQLSEFRKIPRIGQRICGVCQKVCPAGRGELPDEWPVIEISPLSVAKFY